MSLTWPVRLISSKPYSNLYKQEKEHEKTDDIVHSGMDVSGLCK